MLGVAATPIASCIVRNDSNEALGRRSTKIADAGVDHAGAVW
jgi:hypothetical protein